MAKASSKLENCRMQRYFQFIFQGDEYASLARKVTDQILEKICDISLDKIKSRTFEVLSFNKDSVEVSYTLKYFGLSTTRPGESFHGRVRRLTREITYYIKFPASYLARRTLILKKEEIKIDKQIES